MHNWQISLCLKRVRGLQITPRNIFVLHYQLSQESLVIECYFCIHRQIIGPKTLTVVVYNEHYSDSMNLESAAITTQCRRT